MQTQRLTFYQRVLLWMQIGGIQVETMREASAFLRVLEKVRLTDEEVTETGFVANGGNISWQLPEADYGTRPVDFEADEMAALRKAVNQMKGIRVSDAEWLLKLVAEPAGEWQVVPDGVRAGNAVQP